MLYIDFIDFIGEKKMMVYNKTLYELPRMRLHGENIPQSEVLFFQFKIKLK